MQFKTILALFVVLMLIVQTTSLRFSHHSELTHDSQDEQPHRHFGTCIRNRRIYYCWRYIWICYELWVVMSESSIKLIVELMDSMDSVAASFVSNRLVIRQPDSQNKARWAEFWTNLEQRHSRMGREVWGHKEESNGPALKLGSSVRLRRLWWGNN
jgi:hypothetical protein